MCGIFGIIGGEPSSLKPTDVRRITDRLFRLSESRGKEAAGITIIPSTMPEPITVVKSPGSASKLIRNKKYSEVFGKAFVAKTPVMTGAAFGHTRMVTNGSQLDQDNNQPVIYDGVVGVHNGIIVNVDDLWSKHPDLKRHAAVDTEVMLALLRKYFKETGSPVDAVKKAFAEIQGTVSTAVTFADLNAMILATNHGSLYIATGKPEQPIFFASECFTAERLLRSDIGVDLSSYTITHIPANQGVVIYLEDLKFEFFDIDGKASSLRAVIPCKEQRQINSFSIGQNTSRHSVFEIQKVAVPKKFQDYAQKMESNIKNLKRCVKCVLPETVPFIQFNSDGVCNFCSNYKKIELMGQDKLEEALKPYRRPGNQRDCVVSLSGGRDSCYGLHHVVKELGMKPVTYTYDWGMVTDLARRNIARMCGKLGVEHILISADIPWKRENIRMNVEAWLNRPHLGMIPLFMAGDKQFVWYGNRVKKQNKLELDIFTFNLMEKTQFKEEYTGIQFWKPGADADKLGEELGIMRGLKLCTFYGKEFLMNPGYWNRSLWDTFYGFVTYYVMPRTFVPLFRYLEWKEETVVNTLLNEYDFELATDTETTWRIGDGTAPFYNYIYNIVGGFTENDTFRSNQIREGYITRDEALKLVYRDNRPRWDTFKWYCDVVGLDFERTVDRINSIPKTNPTLMA